ncbi:MAG: hypothetical protein AB7K52_13465 [Phycisphaerales bacterium]
MSSGTEASARASTEAASGGVPVRSRRRWKRVLAGLSVLAVAGVIGAELAARFVLRLGDPPLYVADPDVEYVMAPSSRFERFYATSTYNRWSMRSTPDIEKVKSDPRELRVLVMGDSVINGGPQTDDGQLATTRVRELLEGSLQRPVVVANISAGSWGPGNLLGYAKKFGFFGADAVVIVLNHEDAVDVPTFDPLGPEQPTRTPVLALEEVVFRYIPSWLGTLGNGGGSAAHEPSAEQRLALEDQALGALRELVARARTSGAKVIGVLHASRSEIDAGPHAGTQRLRSALRGLEVPVFDDADGFRGAVTSGAWVYRDDIHPMPEGQSILAQVIFEALREER